MGSTGCTLVTFSAQEHSPGPVEHSTRPSAISLSEYTTGTKIIPNPIPNRYLLPGFTCCLPSVVTAH